MKYHDVSHLKTSVSEISIILDDISVSIIAMLYKQNTLGVQQCETNQKQHCKFDIS